MPLANGISQDVHDLNPELLWEILVLKHILLALPLPPAFSF
jgi:hypothetical protein